MRHTDEVSRVESLAETTLFVLGEERVALRKEDKLFQLLEGLEEADRLELADAQGQLEEASNRHKAARERLREAEGRAMQKSAIRARIRECIKQEQATVEDAAKSVTADAVAAGYAYPRPELLAEVKV